MLLFLGISPPSAEILPRRHIRQNRGRDHNPCQDGTNRHIVRIGNGSEPQNRGDSNSERDAYYKHYEWHGFLHRLFRLGFFRPLFSDFQNLPAWFAMPSVHGGFSIVGVIGG